MKYLTLFFVALISGNIFAETCEKIILGEQTECFRAGKLSYECSSIIGRLDGCNVDSVALESNKAKQSQEDSLPLNVSLEQKRKNLSGFQQMSITSSLDGRYFKSRNRSFTILGVEYPEKRCNLEKGDKVYIVSNLIQGSGKSEIRFIQVYNLEKDTYCELM